MVIKVICDRCSGEQVLAAKHYAIFSPVNIEGEWVILCPQCQAEYPTIIEKAEQVRDEVIKQWLTKPDK